MAKIKQIQSSDDLGRFSPTTVFEFQVKGQLIAVYQPGLHYRLTKLNEKFIRQKEKEGKVKWL